MRLISVAACLTIFLVAGCQTIDEVPGASAVNDTLTFEEQVEAALATVEPYAPRGSGSRLLMSDINQIGQQLAACWQMAASGAKASNVVVDIRLEMNPDGSVRTVEVVDKERLVADPSFRLVAESAQAGLRHPRCSKLSLPLEKYDLWKSMVLSFNSGALQ
jgi:hypothetical protein